MQRAETGDARLNREHQTQRVNQQKESNYRNNNHKSKSNSDKEIFKGSSSSNFFNNKNGGKEPEDVEEDNAPTNVNQDDDREQKRKIVRNQNRRPFNSQQEDRTQRPNKPTGFTNNFAGSSYPPTTAKPTSEGGNNERRFGSRQRQRPLQSSNVPPTTFGTSTPAPFRQTQQYNTINRHATYDNGQYRPTTEATKTDEPENYPSNFPRKQTSPVTKETETYPSNIPATNTQYDSTKSKQTRPFENYPTTVDNTQNTQYPTTFPAKPFQKSTQFDNKKATDSFPTTFAPRTNAAYTQIAQKTEQYTKQYADTKTFNTNPPSTFTQLDGDVNPQTTFKVHSSTPRTSPYTHYTPTVPKITTPFQPSTTPVSKSNRFDETQYDYDNFDRKEDELIKTAHSTNIASSRNEFSKGSKAQSSTQKPYYESPRQFSSSSVTSKATPQNGSASTKAAPKPTTKKLESTKKPATKEKNVSYDYAYYDTNVGSEQDYDVNTEIEKSPKKQ